MFCQVTIGIWLAGIVMIFWERILTAANLGKLSWPFLPIERIIRAEYNRNVRTFFGILFWLIVSVGLAVNYWWLVERGYLTYYDFGSALLYGWGLWLLTVMIVFPLVKLGFAGRRLGPWVWLESLSGWLLFSVIFGLLIS